MPRHHRFSEHRVEGFHDYRRGNLLLQLLRSAGGEAYRQLKLGGHRVGRIDNYLAVDRCPQERERRINLRIRDSENDDIAKGSCIVHRSRVTADNAH
ncbi:hypothetical protein D3C85_1649240 [compost metagenome]